MKYFYTTILLFSMLFLVNCEEESPSPLFAKTWVFDSFRGLSGDNAIYDNLYAGEKMEFGKDGIVTITDGEGTIATRTFEFASEVLTFDKGLSSQEVWEIPTLTGDVLILKMEEQDFNDTVSPISNCCFFRSMTKRYNAE